MYGVQRKMKEVAEEAKPLLSLQDKNNMADKQEEALAKDIQHLATWIDMIDAMNDEQLKEYIKNRPEELKTVKIQKSKPRQKVQKAAKSNPTTSTGIMASVWKFHKDDNEDQSSTRSSEARKF
ncbi:uncharacterized protein LOC110813291 [Carica papaya]|uniref:uncharacterized protein LOC110813291 n=1 Tax=Carica papaya TaxID=3649 RepID=UPI000B8D075F|nr:uncharacterized protein LOC110813291 [Carica papaya]